jgi:hypothetical protein
MGHVNVDGQGSLWTITEQLTKGDTPTIVTESSKRPLEVEEDAVRVRQNPFPYDGLFVVLRDPIADKEFSLLIPENKILSARLVTPTDAHGEPVSNIQTDTPAITGTTANDHGIPLQ